LERNVPATVATFGGTPTLPKRIVSVISASALTLASLMSVGPAVADNVLRFTSANGGAVTMDPHSSGLLADRAATMQVYEQLLDRDSNLMIVPQLAVAWKPLDPNTWSSSCAKAYAPRWHVLCRRRRRVQHRAGACGDL
jgi:hypothetical protein